MPLRLPAQRASCGKCQLTWPDRNVRRSRTGGVRRKEVVDVPDKAVSVAQDSLAAPAFAINAGGLANAASFSPAIAPGSIASVCGSFLVADPAQAMNLPLSLILGGLDLQFSSGQFAPFFHSSASQANIQIP